MIQHIDGSIRFEKLNRIFHAQIEYANSLPELNLLAELISATTNSADIAEELLSKMMTLLQIKQSSSDFFLSVDYASNLNNEIYKRLFLLRGFELVVKEGGFVTEYTEQLNRLLQCGSFPIELRGLMEKNVNKIFIGLKEHGDGVVQFVAGESWVDHAWELINLIYNHWDDPIYYISHSLKLVELNEFSGSRANEISAQINFVLYNYLASEDAEKLKAIYNIIKGQQVHYDEEDSFEELCQMYAHRIEEHATTT